MSDSQIYAHWHKKLTTLQTQVGNTPLVHISQAWSKPGVELYAKLEWEQLGQSVKIRPALRMVQEAIRQDHLKPGMHIFDLTSGNTGIAYCVIGAQLGIPVTIVMPENASEERKTIMRAMGGELILLDAEMTSDEVFEYTQHLAEERADKYCYLNQFDNPANWKSHYDGTGVEIYKQSKGRVTHFVSSLGTCGTFTGTARFFHDQHPHVQCIGLHPNQADHELEGWKHLATSRHPLIYDSSLAHQHELVTSEEARYWIQEVARLEGLLLSPSSAGALAGAIKVAENLDSGVVVTIFPDDASKYGALYQQLYQS